MVRPGWPEPKGSALWPSLCLQAARATLGAANQAPVPRALRRRREGPLPLPGGPALPCSGLHMWEEPDAARGLLSTTVTLIGAQGNSAGALGARCFSSPTRARAATSWLREMSSASCPPRGALWLGLCVPLDGGLLWDTQQTQCLLMWLDIKKKRNSVYSQLVTSLNCNAAPRLLKTYLHPSLQEAAVRVKINILTCDL